MQAAIIQRIMPLTARALVIAATLLLAATATAAPAVRVTGTAQVGQTLTAQGKSAAVRWEFCSARPVKKACPTRVVAAGRGRTHVIAPSRAGGYLRASVRRAGTKRLMRSRWVGPIVAAPTQEGGAGTGTGGGGTSGASASTDGPPFSPPGQQLTGQAAVDAIQKYLVNATFTDCASGFPSCPYENRYGFFPSAEMYYCRLTPSPGSDIINAPASFQIIGAEQAADGEWGVTLQLTSYGNTTYYWWDVRPDGSVSGKYWGPGLSPVANEPSEYITGLTWVRGARNCQY